MLELRRLVAAVVNEADPMRLLMMGAPEDEYDPEIDEIADRIIQHGPMVDGIEMVLLIQEVFDRWFFPGMVSWEQSLAMAEAICDGLREERAR
ncbi:MAG: hypothetical protein ACOY93_20645 [Bacillota bacterium]